MYKESPYSFLTFLVAFTFVWVILYTTEPEFIKVSSEVSKTLCGWYAFTISIIIVLVCWVFFYVLRWREVRAGLGSALDFGSPSSPPRSGSVRSGKLTRLERAMRP